MTNPRLWFTHVLTGWGIAAVLAAGRLAAEPIPVRGAVTASVAGVPVIFHDDPAVAVTIANLMGW